LNAKTLRARWLRLAAVVLLLLLGAYFYLRPTPDEVIRPALDRLAKIPLQDRWSNPKLLKIRQFGPSAIPMLRSVLRERNSSSVRFQLWLKQRWPKQTKRFKFFPNENVLTERRWIACQVLQTFGPSARPAVPELIAILYENDVRTVNGVTMALSEIGIDADICEQLDGVYEHNQTNFATYAVLNFVGNYKPASARTVKVLVRALGNPSPHYRGIAAESLGRVGANTPEVIAALKTALGDKSNETAFIPISAALWDLQKDPTLADGVLKYCDSILDSFHTRWPDAGGQGIDGDEGIFSNAGGLLSRMPLNEYQRSKALVLFQIAAEEKSTRIFFRMVLLPALIEFGYPTDKCVAVCRHGLDRKEDYYRLQAAQLLAQVAEKRSTGDLREDELVKDGNVGVRVFGAKLHWQKHHDAKKVVPVLAESLNRTKHQSYYYTQIQPEALRIIGQIGTEAVEAEAAVEALKTDPNPGVVKLASETLEKIRGKGR
jgi:hypothetical protein